MNILLLDQFSDLGGAQQALAELLPSIRERGWRAVLGLPGNGKLVGVARGLGLEVERIDCWPYKSGHRVADGGRFLAHSLRLSRSIRELAKRVEADLVYLNGPRLVPAAALAGLNCPVIFHSHSWLSPDRSRTVTGVALWWMNARVVANCNFVAEQWRGYVREERISTILNGVVGPAKIPPRRPAGAPRIGCIGRISPEKGQREFVAAAARILETMPECRFAVYGTAMFGHAELEGYAGEVRAAAAGLPIEFSGWVSDVYGALAELDLVLVPSVGAEATTRVILEAFAAGVPVIAFDCGGISEVVTDGVTAVLTRSVEEMARAAVALLKGAPERRTAMARAARTEWERRFTKEKFHDRLLAVMEEWARGRDLKVESPAL
jgi:glycosyltransferase involved in cell wall biosynthesis